MSKTKVLIADDEKDILEIMRKKVETAGYSVVTAFDGEDAWIKIVQESPDVILLDLTMPKLDGLDLLKRLRQNPPSSKWQPVIIVSARGELEDMKKGIDLEADHYLGKPCDMELVLKGIRLMESLIPHRKIRVEKNP